MMYVLFAMGFLLLWSVATIKSFWFAVAHTLRGEGSDLFPTDDEVEDTPPVEDKGNYPVVIVNDSSRPDMLWRGETYKKEEDL